MILSNLAVVAGEILKTFSTYFLSTGLAAQAFFLLIVMLVLAFISFTEEIF